MTRVPPHNLQAERSLLGAMLLRSDAIVAAVDVVVPADFYKPAHGHIFAAVESLYARAQPCDPATVADELTRQGVLDQVGGSVELVRLQADCPSIGNAARYARIVAEHSSMRRLIRVGLDIAETGYAMPSDLDTAIQECREMLDAVESPSDAPIETVPLGEFCRGEDTYDWMVPGLIERGDRVVIVAPEASGKSTLVRQMSVCCAFGLHPFSQRSIAPVRVLLVDLENPPGMARRKLRPMLSEARRLLPYADDSMMHVVCRQGGIDLTKRADVRWLTSQIASHRPDVVTAGPMYKMAAPGRDYEASAYNLSAVLDDLRTRFGFALILETHAPQESGGKREMRPIGSSLWLRWPDFGLSFDALPRHPHIVKVRVFKPRDERNWPKFMERGGAWPWTPCRDPEGPKGRPDPEENGRGLRPGFGQEAF